MAVAKNTEELRKQIMAEINKAMNDASKKMLKSMQSEMDHYYAVSHPKYYERTDAMKNTPKVHQFRESSNLRAFTAELDKTHMYTTADRPSMLQVLRLANSGIQWRTRGGAMAHPTIGPKGFWENSLLRMENDFLNSFEKHFDYS